MFVLLSVVLPNVVAPDNCSLFSRCISVEEKKGFFFEIDCIVEVSALTTAPPPPAFVNALKKTFNIFRDVSFEFYPSLTFLAKAMYYSDITFSLFHLDLSHRNLIYIESSLVVSSHFGC